MRNHISSRKYNVADFICKGDFKLWVKVFNILNGIFVSNNEFLLVKKNNQRWSTQFLKFVISILSTLPRDPSTLVDQEDKLQYVNYKLNYINKVIQPLFSQTTINNNQQ